VRIVDRSKRTFPFNAATEGTLMLRSASHHTSFARPLFAGNSIGGWFTKQGVGSVGLLFDSYTATDRKDLTPLQSHCGDGGDTHFYIGWSNLYQPLHMQAGQEISTQYTLFAMPSEPRREQIEDLNEDDLYYFGPAAEAKSKISGWYGTKDVLGLIREDGSATLFGIGKQKESFLLNKAVMDKVKCWKVVDLGTDRTAPLSVREGRVEVFPGFVTVIDAGSALHALRQ
jgi:hypothetical protein